MHKVLMSEWDIPVRHPRRWLGYIQRVLMAVYSSLVSRGSGMSLRSLLQQGSHIMGSCVLFLEETSTPQSKLLT